MIYFNFIRFVKNLKLVLPISDSDPLMKIDVLLYLTAHLSMQITVPLLTKYCQKTDGGLSQNIVLKCYYVPTTIIVSVTLAEKVT